MVLEWGPSLWPGGQDSTYLETCSDDLSCYHPSYIHVSHSLHVRAHALLEMLSLVRVFWYLPMLLLGLGGDKSGQTDHAMSPGRAGDGMKHEFISTMQNAVCLGLSQSCNLHSALCCYTKV